jgi:hypothetical protein
MFSPCSEAAARGWVPAGESNAEVRGGAWQLLLYARWNQQNRPRSGAQDVRCLQASAAVLRTNRNCACEVNEFGRIVDSR